MEDKIIQLVTQTGGIGVGVFAMYILYKIASNHLFHLDATLKDLCVLMAELKEIIKLKK